MLSIFSLKSQGLEEVEVADESRDVEKGVKLGFVSPGACVAGETLTVSGKIIDNSLYKRKASAIDLNVVWFDSDERSNFADAEQPLFKAIALKSHIFSTFHPA